VNLLVNVIK